MLPSVVTGIVRERPQVPAGSGDKSGQPGGAIRSREKGEKERRMRASYRRGAGEETAGHLVGN
jgi:hypothetical protein